MVRWLRWHCPPDRGFEIRALAVWGRARYLSVTEALHNTEFYTWMGKKHFCFFQTTETGDWTPNFSVKDSGDNHYPRAPVDDKDMILPPTRWSRICRYQDLLITSDQVENILSTLDCSKATGCDQIGSRLLKEYAIPISPILCHIFTKFLTKGIYPGQEPQIYQRPCTIR